MIDQSQTKKPNPTDIAVGQRLRNARTLAGMSQEKLGNEVSLSFQQIQKYEKGINRIGASRLNQFAQILNVPPSYFFEDSSTDLGSILPENAVPQATGRTSRMELELVRAFRGIENQHLKRAVLNFCRSISSAKMDAEIEAA
jgi:transcriptional regulator with XRE-family HTH domain